MEIVRENFNETNLDALSKVILDKSDSHLLLASDPESDGATIISINADDLDMIKLFTDLIIAEESFIDLFELAKQIAMKKIR